MKTPSVSGTRAACVACFLSFAIAMPAWSDTLVLRNGATFTGTLVEANPNTISFRDRRGDMRRYSVRDVDVVQFGDAPYQSRGGLGGYDQPADNRQNDRGNGYAQGYENQAHRGNSGAQSYENHDDRGYDQARME